MKTVYTDRPINRQATPSPSLKTLILVSCVVLCMVAIKVFYAPTKDTQELAVMAEITETDLHTEESGETH